MDLEYISALFGLCNELRVGWFACDSHTGPQRETDVGGKQPLVSVQL